MPLDNNYREKGKGLSLLQCPKLNSPVVAARASTLPSVGIRSRLSPSTTTPKTAGVGGRQFTFDQLQLKKYRKRYRVNPPPAASNTPTILSGRPTATPWQLFVEQMTLQESYLWQGLTDEMDATSGKGDILGKKKASSTYNLALQLYRQNTALDNSDDYIREKPEATKPISYNYQARINKEIAAEKRKKAIRRWIKIRRLIEEVRSDRASNSVLQGWNMFVKHVKALTGMEKTRQELYERYGLLGSSDFMNLSPRKPKTL